MEVLREAHGLLQDQLLSAEEYQPCVDAYVRASQLKIANEAGVLVGTAYRELSEELIANIQSKDPDSISGVWALKVVAAVLAERLGSRHPAFYAAQSPVAASSPVAVTPPAPLPSVKADVAALDLPAVPTPSVLEALPVPPPPVAVFNPPPPPPPSSIPATSAAAASPSHVAPVAPPAPAHAYTAPAPAPAPSPAPPPVAAPDPTPQPSAVPYAAPAAPVVRHAAPTDRFRVAHNPTPTILAADSDDEGWSDEESGPERTCEEVDIHELVSHTVGNFRSAVDNLSVDSRKQTAQRRQEYGGRADGTVGRF